MEDIATVKATASSGSDQDICSGGGDMTKVWIYFEGTAKNFDDALDAQYK